MLRYRRFNPLVPNTGVARYAKSNLSLQIRKGGCNMKKTLVFKLNLLFMLLSILATTFARICDAKLNMDGVVAMWLLDEGDGDQISDTSDNGHNGRFVGGNVKWAGGKFGRALEFTQRGWVEMNAPVVVDSVDWSMGCWAKPRDSQKNWANILSSHNALRGISFEQHDNNVNRMGVAMGDGETWGGAGFVKLKAEQWNHMVFTRKKRIGTWYLNGRMDNVKQLDSANPVVASPSNFRIGNWVLGSRAWNGIVDEAFIFERALSQEEIRTIMNHGLERARPVKPNDRVAISWGKIKTSYE